MGYKLQVLVTDISGHNCRCSNIWTTIFQDEANHPPFKAIPFRIQVKPGVTSVTSGAPEVRAAPVGKHLGETMCFFSQILNDVSHGIYYCMFFLLDLWLCIRFITWFVLDKRWIILPLQVPFKNHTPRGPKTFCNWTPRGHVVSWTSGWYCVRCVQCRG